MTGGVASFVRAYESLSADTPIADRWAAFEDALVEHGRTLDIYHAEARADIRARDAKRQAIIARFGLTGLVGPHNSTMENLK